MSDVTKLIKDIRKKLEVLDSLLGTQTLSKEEAERAAVMLASAGNMLYKYGPEWAVRFKIKSYLGNTYTNVWTEDDVYESVRLDGNMLSMQDLEEILSDSDTLFENRHRLTKDYSEKPGQWVSSNMYC